MQSPVRPCDKDVFSPADVEGEVTKMAKVPIVGNSEATGTAVLVTKLISLVMATGMSSPRPIRLKILRFGSAIYAMPTFFYSHNPSVRMGLTMRV